MTKVLFAGAPVEAPPRSDPIEERFVKTGQNTGNTLIGAALKRQLAFEDFATGTGHQAGYVNETFDLIAVPAANFIYEGFDFGYLADFIERTRLPALMVGLGAQSSDLTKLDITVPKGTRRLLSIVAERSASIGVRGEYTASVMNHLGIKNVTLTGCPSLYWHRRPDHRVDVPAVSGPKVVLNGSNNVMSHSFAPAAAKAVERQLAELGMRAGYDFVLQNEMPEILLMEDPDGAIPAGRLEGTIMRLGLNGQAEDYARYIRENGRVFFDVDQWIAAMTQYDFSLGTRFHGNMAAVLAGKPALVIAHDTRTQEMCDLIKLPSLSVKDVSTIEPQSLYDGLSYEAFNKTYVHLYGTYKAFLEKNGVAHRLA